MITFGAERFGKFAALNQKRSGNYRAGFGTPLQRFIKMYSDDLTSNGGEDPDQVDPWIQVASLQHVTVTEAQLKVTANLQYQIENTGLKQFRLLLPADAQGVRFDTEQLADFHEERPCIR